MFILGLNETEGTILLHSSTESPSELIAIALALHLQIIGLTTRLVESKWFSVFVYEIPTPVSLIDNVNIF